MTPSEHLPPPPLAGPGGPASPLPDRPAVAIDVPLRTSPRTVTLELLALVGVGGSLVLAIVTGAGADVAQLWLGSAFIVFRLVGWWFRTYTVTAGELVLDEGILQKRHRVVPFSRIQQVELRQQLLARVLAVTILQVETAGDAGSTAVVLRFLELPRAEVLRDHLLAQQRRARGSRETEPAAGPGDLWRAAPRAQPVRLVHLRPRQLLGAGAMSSPVVSAAAVIAVGVAVAVVAGGSAEGSGPLLALGRWAGITAAAVLGVASLAALSTLLRSWAFELTVIGDDLHVSFGLLDRRQHTLPRHRLQHVTVVDNPVRRRFGIVSVQLHSGATPGYSGGQTSHIEIPAIHAIRLDGLFLGAMADDDWRRPTLRPRSSSARRRAVLRRTVPAASLSALAAAMWWPTGAALLPIALVGVPWGLLAHRRAGWSVEGPILGFSSGALVHHLELIPRDRVQSARTTASPWQRRLGLRTLRIDVAGGAQHPWRRASGLMDLTEDDAVRGAEASAR